MRQQLDFFGTTGLEKALDTTALRTSVISSNIANADTPGYQAKTVVFDGQLRDAMDANTKGDDKPLNNLKPKVETVSDPVDVITEMASLAKNQILYDAYTSRVSGIFSNFKWIIENSGR